MVAVGGPGHGQGVGGMQHFTYRPTGNAYEEEKLYRGLHPMMAKRLHLWRFSNFKIDRLPSVEDIYLFTRWPAKTRRMSACSPGGGARSDAGARSGGPHRATAASGAHVGGSAGEHPAVSVAAAANQRLYWNRILLYVWPPLNLKPDELREIVRRLAPATDGLGLEQVVVRARIPNPATGELREMVVRISSPGGAACSSPSGPPTKLQPLKPLAEYDQKVVRMRQRGLIYPYEIIKMLTPAPEHTRAEFPPGDFIEHDLDADGRLVPVDRPYGQNKSNIIVGVIRNFTAKYPEGMTRVILLGDPSKDLGAIAEPECRRIIAALDLAREKGVPLEWFPISAGAKISMDSGVENMDWIARVLRGWSSSRRRAAK